MSTPATPAPAAPAVTPPPAAPPATPEAAAPATPPAAAPEAKKPEERLDAARIAALVKKEAELVKREQAAKAARAEAAKYEADLKAYRELQETVKADPLKALERLGLSYDKLTEAHLAAPVDSAAAQALKEIEALKQREQEREKAEQTRAQEERAARARRGEEAKRAEVAEFLQKNAEKYELTNLYEAGNHVYELIRQRFIGSSKFDENGKLVEPGKIMSVEEAADEIEGYYEERAKKALASKKLGGQKAAPAAQTEAPPPPPSQTLSNDVGPSATTQVDDPDDVSEEAVMRRTLRAWEAAEARRKAQAGA